MPHRNTTARASRVPTDGPRGGDPIADTYDAWQRSSARLLELERSLAASGEVDPRLEALISEVHVLRSCTAELFVQVVGTVRKDPETPSLEPPVSAATYVRGIAKTSPRQDYCGETMTSSGRSA